MAASLLQSYEYFVRHSNFARAFHHRKILVEQGFDMDNFDKIISENKVSEKPFSPISKASKIEIQKCENCGNDSQNRKYCSPKCSQNAYRSRRERPP